MKYVWICMLAALDVIWLILSIVNVVHTVKYMKEYMWYGSVSDYANVGEYVDCMAEKLKESTVGFIVLHIFVLFVVSLITWMNFKMGGVK